MNDIEQRCLALYETWARRPLDVANGADELLALFKALVTAYPAECAEAFKRATTEAAEEEGA